MGHYEERVKDRSAEQILQTAGGGSGGAWSGPDGDYLRVAADVRSTQELIDALRDASESNSVFSRRVVWLTFALVVVGGAQTLATAWPHLIKQQTNRQHEVAGASEPRPTDTWNHTVQCATRADQWAAAVGLVEGKRQGDVETLGRENHYSPQYERCYVRVSYVRKGGKAAPGVPPNYDELWDAFERKLLATCAFAQSEDSGFCRIEGENVSNCVACQGFISDRMRR